MVLYFLLIFFIIRVNSVVIVKLLNKSMFPDYMITTDFFKDSFYNGASIIFVITILLFAIFGTWIVSIIITDILFMGLIYANNVKVEMRNEFITFSELKTIASPIELLSFIDVSIWFALLVVALTVMSLTSLQILIMRFTKRIYFVVGKKVRISLMIASLVILAGIFIKPNYFNEHVLKYEKTHHHNWNPLERARQDGFLASLIHTIKPTYMDKPVDYKKDIVLDIYDRYQDISKEINKTRDKSLNDAQTLLYLSESLMDPDDLTGLILNETPIPFISKTKKNNIGGTMYSQYIGGGTANLEWSILTSFSLEAFLEPVSITPYSDFYADSKNHSTILDYYDKKKVAIHPFTSNLYKRETIYNLIGFDDFIYLDNGIKHTDVLGSHQYVSDEALNKDIFDIADQEDVGFMHILSMQNHAPYNGEIPDMDYKPEINLDIYPEEKEEELYNYSQGLRATDEAMEKLVRKLKKSDKDTNILFYGDHFPSVFIGMEDQFQGNTLYETPWFLYMNKDRSKKEINYEGLSPAFLMSVLLREGNYYVSPFQGLMDKLLTLEVKRIGRNYVVTNEGLIEDSELVPELKTIIDDYRIIQYDALFGHDWLTEKFYNENDSLDV